MRVNLIGKGACVAGLYLVLAASVLAAVEITWVEPEKFRDIRGGPVSQKSFQNQVIAVLTAYFEEAAGQTLPADQTLRLSITDVDLAGDVEYFFFRFPFGVRVMRDIYFPEIEFNYVLEDAEGRVLKSGEENISDIGYLYSGRMYINDPPFDYEKRMIDDWFNKTFR